MATIEKPTAIERITSNAATVAAVGGATAIGAATLTGPFAPLLGVIPNLVGLIGQSRMEARLQATLTSFNEEIAELRERVDHWLSDDQVAFISETVAAMFVTADEQKLAFLKEAAKNAALSESATFNHGAALGRTLRDLTAQEISFIVLHHGKELLLGNLPNSEEEERDDQEAHSNDSRLFIPLGSDLSLVASGLISLGMLLPLDHSWRASKLHWTHLAGVVKELVQ
nr:hypothetical protein [uncultured Acidovorax sp.]